MSAETYILSRIQAIEAELADLKRQLHARPSRDVKSLYGILRGLEVNDQDFEAAKRSWVRGEEDADA